MFKLIIGRSFEVAHECGGAFIRIGRREWFYSRQWGLVAGLRPE